MTGLSHYTVGMVADVLGQRFEAVWARVCAGEIPTEVWVGRVMVPAYWVAQEIERLNGGANEQ